MSRAQIIVDDRDEGGNTHLMRAALDGQTETVKALLSKGADVNAQNREGRTALMFAVINLHAATVQTLLQSGADVNAQPEDGFTPLVLAACSGDIGIVNALLNSGADVKKTLRSGEAAISHAAEHGYNAIGELLKRAMGQSTRVKSERLPSDIRSRRDLTLFPRQIEQRA